MFWRARRVGLIAEIDTHVHVLKRHLPYHESDHVLNIALNLLAGGEKQRAAIDRAVISRPQLLLADEPTGSGDPTLGRRLLRLFIELNKSGTAVVIATHDLNLMEQYDARRLVLHQGRLHIYE